MTRFGSLLRDHRRRVGLTLRAFAADTNLDPAYVSRIERGVISPPKDDLKVALLAEAVGLNEGSAEWQEFKDAAALDAGRLPSDLASDEALLNKLPILFRTARGERPTRQELTDLYEFLKDK